MSNSTIIGKYRRCLEAELREINKLKGQDPTPPSGGEYGKPPK